MEKEQFLKYWGEIRKNRKLEPRPVRYGHEGSTYAEDGIRITGSRTFVDSVLSRVKDLLAFENDVTRLHVIYQRSSDRINGKLLSAWNCYVQVHRRGSSRKKDAEQTKGKKK